MGRAFPACRESEGWQSLVLIKTTVFIALGNSLLLRFDFRALAKGGGNEPGHRAGDVAAGSEDAGKGTGRVVRAQGSVQQAWAGWSERQPGPAEGTAALRRA